MTKNNADDNTSDRGEDKPLTILQLISADEFGAPQRMAKEISAAVIAAGGRALLGAEGAYAGRIRVEGSELTIMDFEPGGVMRKGRGVEALEQLVASEQPDIIHVHGPRSALAAHEAGAKYITSFHKAQKPGWRQSAEAKSMFGCTRAITPSDYVASAISVAKGVPTERVSVIRPCVDMNIYGEEVVSAHRTIQLADQLGLTEDPRPVVLVAGAITAKSGHSEFVQSVADVVRQNNNSDFLCLLVGSEVSGAAEKLDSQIIAAGMAGIIRRCGRVDDMPAALKLAAVVVEVAPSDSGRLLIEAQAMGRPVMAPNAGAAAEVVEDRVSGRLFDASQGGMAAALAEMVTLDDSARAHFGMAGRGRAHSQHQWGGAESQVLDLYEQVLGKAFPDRVR
ncbi:MAG: glycosyltransferase family 4 protein [Pikeienuella sp.]